MPQISARSVADWDNPAAECREKADAADSHREFFAEMERRCHDRAAECREKAQAAGNPQDREFFAEMERRWLFSRE